MRLAGGGLARLAVADRGALGAAADLACVLEHRVLEQLLAHRLDQLHARHLQQADRLLQLRRHHQLLGELELLLELQKGPGPSFAGSVSAQREDDRPEPPTCVD